MKAKLLTAYKAVMSGRPMEAEEAVAALKLLHRSEDGTFNLTCMDMEEYQAIRLVYPVYAAFESICNKKEGYPDLFIQIKAWNQRLAGEFTFTHSAAFLDMLIHTIPWISQEVYEYYRELADLFRSCLKRTVETCCGAGCVEDPKAAELFLSAVRRACEEEILLTEKYEYLWQNTPQWLQV